MNDHICNTPIAEPQKIDWDQISKDWDEHWRKHPPSYDILESFNDFWNARGGRSRYFETNEHGKDVKRTYYREEL